MMRGDTAAPSLTAHDTSDSRDLVWKDLLRLLRVASLLPFPSLRARLTLRAPLCSAKAVSFARFRVENFREGTHATGCSLSFLFVAGTMLPCIRFRVAMRVEC